MEEGDPLGWMVQFCIPDASQLEKLFNCRMARTNEYFSDSSPEQNPSPGPNSPGTIDISSSESSGSLPNNVDGGVRVNECGEKGGNETVTIEDIRVRVNECGEKGGNETVTIEDMRVRVNECGEKGENERETIEEIGPSQRRRLPASLTSKGKENDVPNVVVEEVREVNKNGGLIGFLDVLKVVFEKAGNVSDEDEDFFEMIQRRGFKFDKPRWWP